MSGLADWTRSTACTYGNCVEVRHVDGHVEVRDSTTPDTVLHVTPADWAAFLVGAKAGEFDGPAAGTGQARETGADRAARPRRFSPEDALSVRERLGAAEPSGDTVQVPDVAALRSALQRVADVLDFADGAVDPPITTEIDTNIVRMALLDTEDAPPAELRRKICALLSTDPTSNEGPS